VNAPVRVGYVLKRYPRYSETFVVNEILALERVGVAISIFSLRAPEDGHFQDAISRVRAPVAYHVAAGLRGDDLWGAIGDASAWIDDIEDRLRAARRMDVRHVYQALRIARDVRRLDITHLHSHFATEATDVARLAAWFAGVPYSFTAHAKDIFHDSVDLEALVAKMRGAARIVTVSDYNARFLCSLPGAPTRRVVRVYNGLPLEEFPFSEPSLRSRRIVSVGRLVEKKGFSVLLEACAQLRAAGVDHHCEIIGGGELDSSLRAQLRALGLEGTVELVGPLPRRAVIERVQNASLLAAPCVTGTDGNRDGLPTVVLEAMALGTPCVATDVTGLPEIVQDGQTGLLVPEGRAEPLAHALACLLDDRALRIRLAHAARKQVETSFDIQRNVEDLCPLFGLELEDPPRAAGAFA
jgi:glycosyltransferase involved in cell wall biosynthesis